MIKGFYFNVWNFSLSKEFCFFPPLTYGAATLIGPGLQILKYATGSIFGTVVGALASGYEINVNAFTKKVLKRCR